MIDPRIYLASRSPRRRELLAQVGIRFDMLLFRTPPREDEQVNEAWLENEKPEDYVLRVARAKAHFGIDLVTSRNLLPRPVLAADTTLDLDGEVIGKPRDAEDAIRILERLSGRCHRVLTAIVMTGGRSGNDTPDAPPRIAERLSISEVCFRPLDATEIRHYVQSGEPMDKAGAYAIQGRAAIFVSEIRGSYSGIMGLPLCETALLLRDFGYPV